MKTSKSLSQQPKKQPAETAKNDLDTRSREQNIAVIAYFKAQARGFGENAELEDWLVAEREFDAALEASQSQAKEA